MTAFDGGKKDRTRAADLIILLEGACFAWVMISFRNRRLRLLNKTAGFWRQLAGFSYTLYLIHFPTMLFVVALIFSVSGNPGGTGLSPASINGVVTYVVAFIAVMLFAWLFASLTEAHTAAVRRIALTHFRKLTRPAR